MKFRKKPVVIEAFQMTEERRWDNSKWPVWMHEAWQKDVDEDGALFPFWKPGTPEYDRDSRLAIMTLEGPHRVDWNDWIIQGIVGELYPCKPDIFEATYEPVEEDPS